ncbi:acyclic terpene utilization AtuA family protein [Specibacter sp. RAF43]|uniref:acyclic terpene utilization AtuA family protein n=1 Tax=Specibacter sp. RAF43 TaxID=3233057 RepID=UPI003F9DE8B2
MKTVRLGAGMAFWGDSVKPAAEMIRKGEIDYLCCDHLAELTMSILAKQRKKDPSHGYTRDVLALLEGVLPIALEKGTRIITNAGGANPQACADRIVELIKEMGLSEVRVAVVTGDDIEPEIDSLMAAGVPFANMDTGKQLADVRDRLTHAAVYTGSEGIVEALAGGADIVVCGRVTDIALYLGPLIHEFGWKWDDWDRLARGTALAHAIECGGQATGGLYAGGWQDVPSLETLGYPIAEVFEDGTGIITKTPDTGGRVDVGTVSEQMVYEILDPSNYLTADVIADFSQIRLEEVGEDRVKLSGVTGKPRPETLKVNMGYRAGFIGEAVFTYTWPDVYAKAQRGLEFLRNRLKREGFECQEDIVEYIGHNSAWGRVVAEPDDPDRLELVVRYAARCADAENARKMFTESVPLYNNGPAGVSGVGTRPPLKELYGLWSALIPREHIRQSVRYLEV